MLQTCAVSCADLPFSSPFCCPVARRNRGRQLLPSPRRKSKTHTSPPLRKPPLNGNGLAVLTWHKIALGPDVYTVTTPAKLAQQLAFLKEQNATVIRLEDAVRLVKSGQSLPPRAVSLGFDDGFKSCYTRVFPSSQEIQLARDALHLPRLDRKRRRFAVVGRSASDAAFGPVRCAISHNGPPKSGADGRQKRAKLRRTTAP